MKNNLLCSKTAQCDSPFLTKSSPTYCERQLPHQPYPRQWARRARSHIVSSMTRVFTSANERRAGGSKIKKFRKFSISRIRHVVPTGGVSEMGAADRDPVWQLPMSGTQFQHQSPKVDFYFALGARDRKQTSQLQIDNSVCVRKWGIIPKIRYIFSVPIHTP